MEPFRFIIKEREDIKSHHNGITKQIRDFWEEFKKKIPDISVAQNEMSFLEMLWSIFPLLIFARTNETQGLSGWRSSEQVVLDLLFSPVSTSILLNTHKKRPGYKAVQSKNMHQLSATCQEQFLLNIHAALTLNRKARLNRGS